MAGTATVRSDLSRPTSKPPVELVDENNMNKSLA